jgi:diketogulonate reductase-like aldo/keto reductase
LLRHDGVFVIPKSSRVEHVEANAAAGDLTLTAEDIALLNDALPRGRRRSGVPML